MKKVTGFFYERGMSYNFGFAAFAIALMTFLLFVISLKIASVNGGEFPDFTILYIVCLLIVVLLGVFSMIYFLSNITVVFVVDNGKLEIDLYKGGNNTCTIPVNSYKFSIISGKSNYNGYGSRVLVELSVDTRDGSFAFTEDLPAELNPGMTIRPETGWYVEKYFSRETGALVELYNITKDYETIDSKKIDQ